MVGVTWEQAMAYAVRMALSIGVRYRVLGHRVPIVLEHSSWGQGPGRTAIGWRWTYRAVATNTPLAGDACAPAHHVLCAYRSCQRSGRCMADPVDGVAAVLECGPSAVNL